MPEHFENHRPNKLGGADGGAEHTRTGLAEVSEAMVELDITGVWLWVELFIGVEMAAQARGNDGGRQGKCNTVGELEVGGVIEGRRGAESGHTMQGRNTEELWPIRGREGGEHGSKSGVELNGGRRTAISTAR